MEDVVVDDTVELEEVEEATVGAADSSVELVVESGDASVVEFIVEFGDVSSVD